MNMPAYRIIGGVFLLVLLVSISALVYRNMQLDRGLSAFKSENYSEAMNILLPLAKIGDSMPQYMLGQMYAFGWGVTKDDDQAMYWFRRAAMWYSGHGDKGAEAAYYVGETHVEHRDNAEALKWYRIAAEGGSRRAAEVLGRAYRKGELGLVPDSSQAKHWTEKAKDLAPAIE